VERKNQIRGGKSGLVVNPQDGPPVPKRVLGPHQNPHPEEFVHDFPGECHLWGGLDESRRDKVWSRGSTPSVTLGTIRAG